MSQGVYSTLSPLFVCGTEQQTKNVVLTESFVEKLG
jgi:hypothetical protein